MKLNDMGVFWIADSEIYVADYKLFQSAADFLKAVIAHIYEAVKSYSEAECGWCKVPIFDQYINKVTQSWMVYRINSEWKEPPFWELIEESGRGHAKVWRIDFEK